MKLHKTPRSDDDPKLLAFDESSQHPEHIQYDEAQDGIQLKPISYGLETVNIGNQVPVVSYFGGRHAAADTIAQSAFDSDPELARHAIFGTSGNGSTQTSRKHRKVKREKSELRKSWERWTLISLTTIAIILTITLPVIHFKG